MLNFSSNSGIFRQRQHNIIRILLGSLKEKILCKWSWVYNIFVCQKRYPRIEWFIIIVLVKTTIWGYANSIPNISQLYPYMLAASTPSAPGKHRASLVDTSAMERWNLCRTKLFRVTAMSFKKCKQIHLTQL